MDSETRYMLSNLVSKKREIKDARKLFRGAKEHANGQPAMVITDGLQAYSQAFNAEFYDHHHSTKHVRLASIRAKVNNNKIERLHGTIRERDKVMRGLKSNETAIEFQRGLKTYYNFVRPHQALDGQTPAQVAKIDLELGQNRWMGLIKKSIKHQKDKSEP